MDAIFDKLIDHLLDRTPYFFTGTGKLSADSKAAVYLKTKQSFQLDPGEMCMILHSVNKMLHINF